MRSGSSTITIDLQLVYVRQHKRYDDWPVLFMAESYLVENSDAESIVVNTT